MITFFTMVPALLGIASADPAAFPRVRITFVQNEFILRIPVRAPNPALRSAWVEKKGPKCIKTGAIRGAFLSGTEHVDFVLNGNDRVRAVLGQNCPALDFYEGFYLNSPDKQICARRDMVRSRMGGGCTIAAFRKLIPVRRSAVP